MWDTLRQWWSPKPTEAVSRSVPKLVEFCHVCGNRPKLPIVPRSGPFDEHDYGGPGMFPPDEPEFYFECEHCEQPVLRPNLGSYGPFLECPGCNRSTYLSGFCVYCGHSVS